MTILDYISDYILVYISDLLMSVIAYVDLGYQNLFTHLIRKDWTST